MNNHVMEIFYVCVMWILASLASFISIYGGEHVMDLWQYAVAFTPFIIFMIWLAAPISNGDKK